ncbi:metal-dependent hydrolase [Novosphingobium sp. PC22D]|uniref:metal-dependent hydrolase n=1 Tax=Novosphingobium sp. PC22D TaxID=1962403 RepID=UPI000BF0EBB8|nr:metal-dependent hydrolase [Novosphingobium sp. PC22D]PEQ13251.1 metal-dependent hydrolase [Novosphingobium sp. PC22D]
MDNVTHSLAGWALAETGLKRRTRKGLAALVLAANMPDIDVFTGWVPWIPLATHRGFTHGLLGGVVLMPPLLAALLWLLDRWQASRGASFKSGLPMHFGWLLALSYLGALTHPLLDWQNTYAVQLMSPWNARWYHNDALFIIDPWIWIVWGAAIWLARRRWSRGLARPGVPAIAGVAAAVAYIALNGAISQLARKAPAQGAGAAAPASVYASPPPLAFWRREVVWRERGMIGRGRYDPLVNFGALAQTDPPEPDNLSDPLVRRAMHASPEVERFLRWSTMTTAQVEREPCQAFVTFGDARFSDPRTRGGFTHVARVPIERPGCR